MNIIVSSFGYRASGPPEDAQLVFDARAINDPARIKGLYWLTGLDDVVRDNVLGNTKAQDMLSEAWYAILRNEAQYEYQYHVAFGCTRGKHRSVALAEELGKRVAELWDVKVCHIERSNWPKREGICS